MCNVFVGLLRSRLFYGSPRLWLGKVTLKRVRSKKDLVLLVSQSHSREMPCNLRYEQNFMLFYWGAPWKDVFLLGNTISFYLHKYVEMSPEVVLSMHHFASCGSLCFSIFINAGKIKEIIGFHVFVYANMRTKFSV